MSVEKIKELDWQIDWVQIYANSNGELLHFPYYQNDEVFTDLIQIPFDTAPKISRITLTQSDLKELAEWCAAKNKHDEP